MSLTTKFSRHANVLRSNLPLSDDQMFKVAPSIFAQAKHASRSKRYTYIPTIELLNGLRNEGFRPFMVCQARCHDEIKHDYTKHMIRLRHADQIAGQEANEIILLNSHDGSSSYQMLSGVFRFVCQNGLVCGNTWSDIRIAHKGNIIDQVIDGAFRVLDDFEQINAQKDGMKLLALDDEEQFVFARAALALKYDDRDNPPPVTEAQVLGIKRMEDRHSDLWTTFNRTQENLIKGGLCARSASGRKFATRAVTGIDQSVKLNRALWILAEQMRKLKG